jgi:hypothetical protein
VVKGRHGTAALLALACALTSAGCVQARAPVGQDQLRDRADEVLARYEAAATKAAGDQTFVPVGELTGQLGDWEPGVGENGKSALLSGQLKAVAPLPAAPSTTGRVAWPDGASRSVTLLSGAQALAQLVSTAGSSDCSGCTPLQVTGAELITGSVETSRGTAEVPLWAFSLRGTRVRVTRLAVRPQEAVRVVPPPWDPHDSPGGIAVERARLARDGVTLTVTFTGAPGPASEPCGADYTAEPVESSTAVVVIVRQQRAAGEYACSAVGARRNATAALSRPLGSRTVLDVVQGLPVPVTSG